MRNRTLASVLMASVILFTGVASAAAQDSTASPTPATIQTDQAVQTIVSSGQIRSLRGYLALSESFGSAAAAGGGNLTPYIIAGLNSFGSTGFAVGGGAWMSKLAQHDEFALAFDGQYSNAGGCPGCGAVGFHTRLIVISAFFNYLFKDMSSGWTPFVFGGLAFSHFSYTYDASVVCTIGGINYCSSSATSGSLAFGGGLKKNKIGFQGRVGAGYGGSFEALFMYLFGGK